MSKQQTRLKNKWKKDGYFVINLVRIIPIGMPDLICVKPNHVVFVESKEDWDRLSILQTTWLDRLTRIGFECYVNDKQWTTNT